ncbi:KRAB-A domain-containing protein 2 [Trichonephila clavipes]|nr:KRAB-A domain-containing protein 2 [Trichonephila clavipes]
MLETRSINILGRKEGRFGGATVFCLGRMGTFCFKVFCSGLRACISIKRVATMSHTVDNRNVLVVVVGIEDSGFYKLANENGTLKQFYTRNQFVICKEKLLSIDKVYFPGMSLREAAASNSRSGRQGYT